MADPGRKYLSKSGASKKPHHHPDDKGREKLKRWCNSFSRRKLSYSQMVDFWRDAVDMVERSDPDIITEVAEKLVNDIMGRQCVEQVLHHDYPGPSAPSGLQADYLVSSLCFMWFFSHREIVNSFTVEKNISTLYRYLYGSDGSEVVKFFSAIVGQLSDEADSNNRQSKLWGTKILGRRFSFSHVLARVLEFLRHTLRRNRAAGFHPGFQVVIQQLRTLAILITSDDKFYPAINDSLTEVFCIQRYSMESVEQESRIAQSKADKGDYPGHLSQLGPRHDNDFAKIRSIKLLPTVGEIMSKRQDFLPLKDQSDPCFHTGFDRLTDTQFRLIRHDHLNEVKETIKRIVKALAKSKPGQAFSTGLKAHGGIYWYLYREASVVSARFDVNGFHLHLSVCEPLLPMYKGQPKAKHRQLECGDLACLLGLDNGIPHVTFVRVSGKSSEHRLFIQVIDPEDQCGLKFLFQQLSKPLEHQNHILVAFPGNLPLQFLPILRNLQEMACRGTHPFRRWAVPALESVSPLGSSTSNPPTIKSRDGEEFCWDLKPILKSHADHAFMHTLSSLQTQQGLECIEQKVVLDMEQCVGLVEGLSPGMTIVQGPPATGKQFLGLQLVRVLIHNKLQKPVGPIICIFSTQRALDKFLKDLLVAGINNIIRVGDTSESPTLQSKNLKAVVYPSIKPHHERRKVFESRRDLGSLQSMMNTLLEDVLRYPSSWGAVKETLKRDFPGIYQQVEDEAGWEEWRGDYQKILENLGSLNDTGSPTRILEPGGAEDIWKLSERERAQVMRLLLERVPKARPAVAAELVALSKEHKDKTDQLEAQYNENARRCLQNADVIAILATKIPEITQVLSSVNSKFVICEEAGEILEGHLMSAIPPSCRHLVQIGDYMQLRPPINSYLLSAERGDRYRLDESLFERLINQKALPVIQLKAQRGIRGEIAALLRCTLDQDLQDHSTNEKFPDIAGMGENVFLWDHNVPEDESNDASTKMPINDWEARMAYELVCHLARQGQYKTEEIVVLTPYPSQLHRLQRELNSNFLTVLCAKDEEALAREGLSPNKNEEQNIGQNPVTGSVFKDALRIATVDNFSGEKAKIVVATLVRSNASNKVGYMESMNRIHVLLSRATQGLYIICNADTARSAVPMWGKVCEYLHTRGAIGKHLRLRCPRHPNTENEIAEPEGFLQLAPEGGCKEMCDKRLNLCNHPCPGKCHSSSLHRMTVCVTSSCERAIQQR